MRPSITITTNDVPTIIEGIEKGKFFSLHFERVAAKCPHCAKSNKKWNGLHDCPVCGSTLSYERESLCQKGIEHPHNPADTPKGTGVSAETAFENGYIKFYDCNVKDSLGNKIGGYRQAKMELVKRITVDGVNYVVR